MGTCIRGQSSQDIIVDGEIIGIERQESETCSSSRTETLVSEGYCPGEALGLHSLLRVESERQSFNYQTTLFLPKREALDLARGFIRSGKTPDISEIPDMDDDGKKERVLFFEGISSDESGTSSPSSYPFLLKGHLFEASQSCTVSGAYAMHLSMVFLSKLEHSAQVSFIEEGSYASVCETLLEATPPLCIAPDIY